jgi:hypothetical protein
MTMSTDKYKWRDWIVLLICWGAIFFTAVANWASDGLPIEETTESVQSHWQLIEPYIFTILPLIILITPLLILLISRAIPTRSFTVVRRRFHRTEVFWGLVFLFNTGQALLLIEDYRNDLLLEFFFITIVAGIILWLFYGREEIDRRKIIFTVTLWIGIFIIRWTIPFLQENIAFASASWYTKIYVLLMVLLFIGSVSLPLFVLFDRNQKITVRIQEFFRKIPVGIWAVFFILASLWTFAFFWTMENEAIGVLAMRLGSLAITYSAAGILLWVFDGEVRRDVKDMLPMGKPLYAILLGLLLVVYVVLAFHVGANNLEKINPDGLSYLNIAREYANGNLAIRGYWAPLLSWLIAPAISFGVDPHVSYLFLVGLSGFFWVLTSIFLAKRMGIGRVGRMAIAAGMIVITLSQGFSLTTPDLLGSLFICLYFYWITHPDYEGHPIRYGMIIGLTGALAYYSKYYNLPFVLAHLAFMAGLRFFHKRQIRSILIGTITSIIILGCSVAPWLLSLYNRYGEFTISTSGAIVHATVGPESNGHVCWQGQLCDQPKDILFPWEDPQSQYYASYGWSIFDNLDHFRYQIRLLKNNVRVWTSVTLFKFGPLLPLGLLVLGFAMLIFWKDVNRRFFYSWTFLTILLYASGYMINFSSQSRYYLPILPLLFLASFSFLQAVLGIARAKIPEGKIPIYNIMAIVVYIISILSLGHLDLIKFYLANENDPCLKNGAEIMAHQLEAPIAGSDFRINYVAYYTSTRTIGAVSSGMTVEDTDMTLHEFGVKTFLIPDGSDLALQLVGTYRYPVLFTSQLCGIEYLVLGVP